MNCVFLGVAWLICGLCGWIFAVNDDLDITAADLAVIPLAMFFGPITFLAVLLILGDRVVVWRRK